MPQALKWGMSGWNSETAGSWNSNTGDEAKDHSNWAANNAPDDLIFDDPIFDMYSTDGAEILRQRVEAVIEAGFKLPREQMF